MSLQAVLIAGQWRAAKPSSTFHAENPATSEKLPEEFPFLLRLMAKDLGYAIAEGKKVSVELGTAAVALNSFQKSIAAGHGEKDIAAVVEQFRKV